MKMCIICKKNPATVPDRNTMNRQKKLCSECHSKRLRSDLVNIVKLHNKALETRPRVHHSKN